jgi:uncharacterized protein
MIGHLRVKSPLSQLGIFLGLFGASFILASLLMAMIILAKGIPVAEMARLDWTSPRVISAMKLVQALSSVLIFLVPALVFAFITFRQKPLYFLGLKSTDNKQMYLLAVLAILLAFPFVMWLGEMNQYIPMPKWMNDLEKDATKQMEAFLKAENTTDVLVNVFIIALLPAICEEICFRGALQRIVINITKNAWVGIILTSVFFSALHMQFQGFFPRMFLGMLLGAIYWYSGSLWPSILAHFVNNAVQVIAVSKAPEYIDKNPSVSIWLALISGLLVWAILWVFKSFSTVSYNKVYEPDRLNRTNQFLV